jgi:hypothetical protein
MTYTIISNRLDCKKVEGDSITDKELLEMGANIEALIEGGHILGDETKASSTQTSNETAAPVVESTSAISEGATING